MKRLLPLLLALLLLAACGTAPAAEPDPVPPAETEPGENTETLPEPSVGLDEDELPILPAEDGETPALSDTQVTLDGISSFLRVTLPEGWTWEQAKGKMDGAVYALYPESDPDFKVELRFWPDGFGMCGTGVTFSEYTLPNGQDATVATEMPGDSMSWILILPESPDAFTIQFDADPALYETHRAELELMLGTIQQGVRAEMDVVTPQTATG